MTQKIVVLADVYCSATGLSRARVSTLVFNRGGKIAAIVNGAGLTTDSYENALDWFAEHWPVDAVWPEGVEPAGEGPAFDAKPPP